MYLVAFEHVRAGLPQVLVAPRNEDTDRLMGHLESEIEVMRSLRHENIVRYWGTARSDTGAWRRVRARARRRVSVVWRVWERE